MKHLQIKLYRRYDYQNLGWLKGLHSDEDDDAKVVQSSSTPAGRWMIRIRRPGNCWESYLLPREQSEYVDQEAIER